MDVLSDLFTAAAALGAAAYCLVLARRLRALGTLEGGMGSAIAVLSSQVEDLRRALASAQDGAARSGAGLETRIERAEAAARRLELLLASMHDLPDPPPDPHRDTPRPRARAPEPDYGADRDPLRAPSRWPQETVRRPAAEEPPARARVLRRRQANEDLP